MSPDTDAVAAGLAEIEEHGPHFVEDANGIYGDALLLVGRVLGGHPDAQDVVAIAVDAGGMDLEADGVLFRMAFPQPATNLEGVLEQALALVALAHEQSGDETVTSAEKAAADLEAARTFLVEVLDVEDVQPHLRRITVQGPSLEHFQPKGPDTCFYVLIAPEGKPLLLDEGSTYESISTLPEDERPVGAYYTLWDWRPEVLELDLLFVLHGDEGPLSAWAARAEVGDALALWGPRDGWNPHEGADGYVLVADETGQPAVAQTVASLPDDVRIQAVVETDDEAGHLPFPEHPGLELTRVHREGAAPGTTTLLEDAVRALEWPSGSPYVWGGAESGAMTAIRKHVRNERGVERAACLLTGYWRLGDERH
jgi:NADPH-dependent ferric siderophore reductase